MGLAVRKKNKLAKLRQMRWLRYVRSFKHFVFVFFCIGQVDSYDHSFHKISYGLGTLCEEVPETLRSNLYCVIN